MHCGNNSGHISEVQYRGLVINRHAIADIIEIEMFQLPVPSTALGIHSSGQKTLPGAGKLVQDSHLLSGPNLNGIHGESGGMH